MVDRTPALESEYVTVDLVKGSPSKKLVVVDPGSFEKDEFGPGTKLTVRVNIDGKSKIWKPNKQTVENLQALGKDTTAWLSKPIVLAVEKVNGKDCVIGKPEAAEPTPATAGVV